MKWLFWNIRGVNKRYKQKEVRKYIRSNKINLVGLVETKVKEENAQKILKYIAPGWDILTNYREAKNGRVWLLWNSNILMVTKIRDDPQMIHSLVQSRQGDIQCYLTVVYGFNGLEQRKELWQNLQQIATIVTDPWLVAGDFNVVLYANDRLSCNPVSFAETEDFSSCLQQTALSELPWQSEYYTWTNRQPGVDKVSSRIDRVLGNYEWLMNWNHVETVYDLPQISNHAHMLLTLTNSSWNGKVPFRFFNAWTNHQDFTQIVTEGWNTMNSAARRDLKDIQEQLASKYSDSLLKRENETLLNLENWSTIEENILQQKARAKWIQPGDDNTKYFTAVMKDRSQRKQINDITTRGGDRITDPEGIKEEILDFYKSLMGSTARTLPAINRSYMSNGPRLTQQQRRDLCADVTD
ncbi:PREDICTED: uncharacterized protein LOC109221818 [Nicotiana attenuata]|uniref:uncharacterized protein LOC109221818 n=1 Tax=Nicotiana attenuata TaxID=49451 RepID=UPI0009049592|nr:PREDICTED: uncharacterized protein LOC109221818 [Nicotiana attenuata]